ncbi:MAG: phosphoribosylanthranilate isomerase [Coriobacteriales bacterium]|nr:phosphoribosylanthranilate isomerase [Coriobacteriales bacterium]
MDSRCHIKLCGMFREQDLAVVNEFKPDMVGFVVDFPRSHRSVTPERLAELAPQVDAGIERVGVFVDEPIDQVVTLYESGLIDAAQLHGHESDAYVEELRAQAPGLKIVQAFVVKSAEDAARAQASVADMVLLDGGQGQGMLFDWSFVREVRRPYIVAGGLTPANVGRAVSELRPWGVDMSSGIETDRVKDPEKMRAAVAAVRGAE